VRPFEERAPASRHRSARGRYPNQSPAWLASAGASTRGYYLKQRCAQEVRRPRAGLNEPWDQISDACARGLPSPRTVVPAQKVRSTSLLPQAGVEQAAKPLEFLPRPDGLCGVAA
jgi:hypothetical protein